MQRKQKTPKADHFLSIVAWKARRRIIFQLEIDLFDISVCYPLMNPFPIVDPLKVF